MHILLIEDDAAAAACLCRGLAESGHVVDDSGDGEEGLARARGGDYDVLIVDRMLPGRDGLSLVAALRAGEEAAGDRTPVLLLSALGEVDDRIKGMRARGDNYLVKPLAWPTRSRAWWCARWCRAARPGATASPAAT